MELYRILKGGDDVERCNSSCPDEDPMFSAVLFLEDSVHITVDKCMTSRGYTVTHLIHIMMRNCLSTSSLRNSSLISNPHIFSLKCQPSHATLQKILQSTAIYHSTHVPVR